MAPKRKEAIQLAKEIVRNEQMADHIDSQRDIVNFDYWRMRVGAEQDEDALNARKHVFQGDRSYAENDLVAARNAYDQGLIGWRKVLDKYPAMGDELAAGDDLMDMIKRYRRHSSASSTSRSPRSSSSRTSSTPRVKAQAAATGRRARRPAKPR